MYYLPNYNCSNASLFVCLSICLWMSITTRNPGCIINSLSPVSKNWS